MRSPHEQILDLVVKMDARGARKVRDMADAHLRDLEPPIPDLERLEEIAKRLRCNCWLGQAPYGVRVSPQGHDTACPVYEGAELQRGLEAAVVIERERLDGPDDDSEEPGP